ncbi:ATP-binding protein [Motilibacter rhizosphaerae]|uniref:ATP-binding protein n=1 Tax=Motilibacter rhizosphaerae TaxID=598652 RepID=UPI001E2F9A30|nr:ATP-binding protein [Motilibacter rhizosphaerae]
MLPGKGHHPTPARRGMATVLLPHAASSVGVVRSQLSSDLLRCGLPLAAVDDVVLVASEIVSNALKHARPLPSGRVRVHWQVEEDALEVEVTDGGSGTRPRRAEGTAPGAGRGLRVVDRLARLWGVRDAPGETTVWAVVDLDARRITLESRALRHDA